MTQRIPLLEKELIVINIHNSAYDKSGIKKNKEKQHILNFAEREFEKGNYVVIGGDWNRSPPELFKQYNTRIILKTAHLQMMIFRKTGGG